MLQVGGMAVMGWWLGFGRGGAMVVGCGGVLLVRCLRGDCVVDVWCGGMAAWCDGLVVIWL